MTSRLSLIALLVFSSAPRALCAADTVDDVIEQISEKWSDIRTLSADMVMTIEAGPTPLKSTGNFKLINREGVEKKRMTMSFDGGRTGAMGPMEQTVIYDGEFAWTIREAPDGRKLVVKQRPDAMEGTPGGQETFAQLKEAFELKLLPDASVDGESAHVIEATPKQTAERGIAKFQFYIVKDTGILSKTIGFNEQGGKVNEILFTNIKINRELDPALFVAEFDAESKVLDMTKQNGQ